MSALARPNLVDFIEFLIHTPEECTPLSQVSQLNKRNIEVERDKNFTGQGCQPPAHRGLRPGGRSEVGGKIKEERTWEREKGG